MVTEQQISQFLKHSEIFGQLEPAQLEAIAKVTRLIEYAAGDEIVRQGDNGQELFIVVDGKVTVFVEDKSLGVAQPILSLGQLQSFGEMSLLTDCPRSATIRADVDTICISLARASFDSILEQLPRVAVHVSRYLAGRLYQQIELTGVRFVTLQEQPFDAEVYGILPHNLLKRYQAVPLRIEGQSLVLAMTRPNDITAVGSLRDALPGMRLTPMACGYEDYQEYLARVIEPALGQRAGEAAPTQAYATEDLEMAGAGAQPQDQPAEFYADMLRNLILFTLNSRANELHFEPWPDNVGLRLKVDGELRSHGRDDLTPQTYPGLVAYLKRLTGLSPDPAPQVGTAQLRLKGAPFDLRLSTLPTRYGQRLALSLVDPSKSIASLTGLFHSETLSSLVRTALNRAGGTVLFVGPGGSGRSTSLYASLRDCFGGRSDKLVVTVEDPIRFGLDEVLQTEVDPEASLGYAELVAGALRHNPDVLMIDELRDLATVETALDASLGGVTLLAAWRANDAVDALTSLRSLGCAPNLLAGAIRLVVGQRLLRRVCPDCRSEVEIASGVRNNLVRANLLDEEGQTRVMAGRGCAACEGTGTRDRVACFEALRFNDFLGEIVAGERPAESIRRAAISQKLLVESRDYARCLLAAGEISPTEALRVYGH
ncbi:MAG: Flp pilus assembly complex ATPase component TadA [Candidatus Eremiobacteraeota bacterium]|nr:Flp pilus assembly complex ATPase component TadA [Candidatus Eremiobacteraeota bacterium]